MNVMYFIRHNGRKVMQWISLTAFTGVLSARWDGWGTMQMRFLGVVLSAMIWGYCIFRTRMFPYDHSELLSYKGILLGLAAGSWLYVSIDFWKSAYQEQIGYMISKMNVDQPVVFVNALTVILFILCFAGAYCMAAHIYEIASQAVKYFIRSMDDVEKVYLKTWIIVVGILLLAVYNLTTVFYNAGRNNVLYTYDSNDIYVQNVFMIMGQHENDVRQSLFALFSLPVSMAAYVAARIVPFPHAYAFFIQLVQDLLLAVTFILISRMMGISGKKKAGFFLFVSASYSTLLFSLVIEQYIILTFWLVVSIYCIVEKVGNRELCAVGAVGTMPTNALVLFWEYKNSKNLRTFIRFALRSAMKFLACIICFGQLGLILDGVKNMIRLAENNMQMISMTEKIKQFLHFVRCCFAAPAANIIIENDTCSLVLDHTMAVDVLGLAILVFLILGSIFLGKKAFVQICIAWLVFSAFLLLVIGWCAASNDMILFIYYFGWSFSAVIYLGLMHFFKDNKRFWLILSLFIVCMAYGNLMRLAEIIKFGTTYYPVS